MHQSKFDEDMPVAPIGAGLAKLGRREVRRSNSDSGRPGLFGKEGMVAAQASAVGETPPWGPDRGLSLRIELKLLIGTAVFGCGLLYSLFGSLLG